MSLGGYGADFFGELLGGGGPINVQRAVAMAGQVVRVAFNEEPLNKSGAGLSDALNPANYSLSVVTGQAKAPVPTTIIDVVQGPGRGLGSSDWGVDVAVDRAMAVAVVYQVSVSNIVSAMGGALGTPATANFMGISVPRLQVLPRKKPIWWDFSNPVAKGSLVVDDSGDIAVETDRVQNFKKRVFRRFFTTPNAFAFLKKGYGVGIALMEVASGAEIAAYRKSAIQQIQQEPETQSANVQITVTGNGIATVNWSAVLKTGETASGSFPVNAA